MSDQKKLLTRRDVLIAGSGIGLAGSLAMLTAGTLPSGQAKDASSIRPMAGGSEWDAEWKEVAEIFETKGIMQPGNVLLIELPRSDIHATIFNVPIKPDLALDT